MKLSPLMRTSRTKGTAPAAWDQRLARSALTLIELLVVIGVLGLLAAFCLTALSNARAKGLQTQCANNLRQLGIALEEFVSDNHGYPFFAENINPPSGFPKEGWWDALGPYASNFRWNTNRQPYQSAGLFHCPAANPPPSPPWPVGLSYHDYGYNGVGLSRLLDTNGSLGLSPWMGNTTNQQTPLTVSQFEVNQLVSESQIKCPSDMMAIGDGFSGNNRSIVDCTASLWRTSGAQDILGSTRRVYARHRGKAEVVFCDGHVEGPRLQTLFNDETDPVLSRWNRDHQPHRERLTP
jgi:prepilin-type N-terminal cleavage/methylation domain-containing protein/prepilin-type processing-associated H-X9-DG protein